MATSTRRRLLAILLVATAASTLSVHGISWTDTVEATAAVAPAEIGTPQDSPVGELVVTA